MRSNERFVSTAAVECEPRERCMKPDPRPCLLETPRDTLLLRSYARNVIELDFQLDYHNIRWHLLNQRPTHLPIIPRVAQCSKVGWRTRTAFRDSVSVPCAKFAKLPLNKDGA